MHENEIEAPTQEELKELLNMFDVAVAEVRENTELEAEPPASAVS